MQTLSLWNVCLQKGTRFSQPVSWSLYSHGWFWMESTSWALNALYLTEGISWYGGGRSKSLRPHQQQFSPVNPLCVANPAPGVGGGRAPKLVDWQMIFTRLPVFATWCFLFPEENKFLSIPKCLLCTMTALFPFCLRRDPERGNCLDAQSISFTEEKCFCL